MATYYTKQLIMLQPSSFLKNCYSAFTYTYGGIILEEIKRSEIYNANLNPIIGSEQGGRRPVLIIQNDIGNKHSPTAIVAAITSKEDKHSLPTHVSIEHENLPENSVVLLEQIRTIDKTRIEDFLCAIDEEKMNEIDQAIVISFGIKYFDNVYNGRFV